MPLGSLDFLSQSLEDITPDPVGVSGPTVYEEPNPQSGYGNQPSLTLSQVKLNVSNTLT
jgi:hypothetical protein